MADINFIDKYRPLENFNPKIGPINAEGSQFFSLDIVRLEDSFEKALAILERPFANKAYVQDLGMRARRITFETVWFDNALYRNEMAVGSTPYFYRVNDFLKLVQTNNILELHHPTYGIIRGNVNSISVSEDDTLRYATVNFTFVEEYTSLEPSIIPSRTFRSITALAYEGLNDVERSTELTLAEKLSADLGNKYNQLSSLVLGATDKISDKLTTGAATVRIYATFLDQCVNLADGVVSNILNPINSIISSIEFSTSVPSRLLRSFALAAERIALLNNTLASAPKKYVEKMKYELMNTANSLNILADSFSNLTGESPTYIASMFLSMGSAVANYYIVSAIETDETKRQQQKSKEISASFTISGEFVGNTTFEISMTVYELEILLYGIKDLYQLAIGEWESYLNSSGITQIRLLNGDYRELKALKKQANDIQDYINRIKIERSNIKTIKVTQQPLHIICMKNGLSYQAAERLLQINPNIKNPTFVEGEIKVYV